MPLTIREQADAWIAYAKTADASDDVLERGFRLNEMAFDEPMLAWNVITEVVSRYTERELFGENQTEGKRVLSNLGAGPLETLLSQHGTQLIEKVEAEARADRRIYWTLGCLWQNSMPDEIWGRVQRITRGFRP